MNRASIAAAVRAGFDGKRVLVVGDVMLDRYLWGSVERVSPEAPVPVLRPSREAERAGAAGNLALNLAALGLDVSLAGLVGDDPHAGRLRELWQAAGVGTDLVQTVAGRPTTVKTRIIAGHQQVLRVDAEDPTGVADDVAARLAAAVEERIAGGVDAVVLSDYAKGVLSAPVCRAAIEAARRHGVPVLVDPKGRDWERYRGATLLTPNQKELEAYTGVAAAGPDATALVAAGREAARALDVAGVVLTRGEHGMVWIAADSAVESPARAREVFDVSGAGDTVLAALTAATVAGLGHEEALQLANVAAGIVVARVGTAVVDRRAVLRALHPHGGAIEDALHPLDELLDEVAEWRGRGERVVFTNGCFDLLHAGHVVFLQRAAAEGQRLIVGLNSDASVRGLKGDDRPVVNETDRACVLAALAAVDAVVLFDEPTPIELIRAIRPDVLVKGGDYTVEQVVGHDAVAGWGGRVAIVPLVDGKSTTNLIRSIAG